MEYQLSKPLGQVRSKMEFESALQTLGWDLDMYQKNERWKKEQRRRQHIQDCPFSEAIDKYRKEYLSTLSDRTRKVYEKPIILDYQDWILKYFGRDPMLSELDEVVVTLYLASRRDRRSGNGHRTSPSGETSVAYQNQILSCIRGFYKFLHKSKLIDVSPAKDVKTTTVHDQLPRHLTLEEVVRLLNLARHKRRYAKRDFAIVAFMLWTGARIEEVTLVKVKDVDWGTERICLLGKGRNRQKKPRVVPMSKQLQRILSTWLVEGHGALLRDGQVQGPPGWSERPLFFAPTGGSKDKSLSLGNLRCTLNRLFNDLLVDLGMFPPEEQWMSKEEVRARRRSGTRFSVPLTARHLRSNITPHSLRHTYAFLLLEGGVDLNSIREWLGHGDLGTTAIYLKLSPKEHQEKVERHPLAHVDLAAMQS